jgi:hypothetical protein
MKLTHYLLLCPATLPAIQTMSHKQGRPLPMGQPGKKRPVGAPPHPKTETFAKKCEALQYCDSNEFMELTVGASRVFMSKAAINNICSNKHKA